jgi:photosystem II stability/assembly factor-like uncharacterized protein
MMKTLLGALLLAPCLAGLAPQSHRSAGEFFRQGKFVGSDSAWMLTETGVIWRTNDGGHTWTQTVIDTSQPVRPSAIDFIDKQVGWMVDEDGDVRKTTNGGATWQRSGRLDYQSLNTFVGPNERIQFADSLNGWVIYPWGIWLSHDGGLTWQHQSVDVGKQKGSIHRCQFTSPADGWVVGRLGRVLRTSDSGKSWREQVLPADGEATASGISSPDGINAWIVASPKGGIYGTKDGGDHWFPQSVPNPGAYLESIHFVNSNEGWAVGYQPKSGLPNARALMLHTTDGGITWEVVNTGIDVSTFQQVFFCNSKQGWVVYQSELFRTEDGGKSWREVLRLRGWG